MAEFINTADIIGDEEMCDQIIMRTVTEYKENRISKVGQYAFYGCTALTVVDVPNVTSIEANSFYGCSALTALILRSATVCTMANTNALTNSAIASGTGYIYVPRSLVDSYKSQTNFSTYAEQNRAIEDYTNDGTVTGSFNWCTGVELDKTSLTFDEWKQETLTATMLTPSPHGFDVAEWKSGDESIARVANGVVTPIGKGTTTITASCNGYSASCEVVVTTDDLYPVYATPYNGSEEGDLPAYKLDVVAGDVLLITHYLTKPQGYLYDGRGCGLGYKLGGNTVNTEATVTLTIPQDGYIAFSCYYNDSVANGGLAPSASNRLYGKYLRVKRG